MKRMKSDELERCYAAVFKNRVMLSSVLTARETHALVELMAELSRLDEHLKAGGEPPKDWKR
jgi:hypothetical protein